jgi:hypothetical protein
MKTLGGLLYFQGRTLAYHQISLVGPGPLLERHVNFGKMRV